jgi:hypothetical protein
LCKPVSRESSKPNLFEKRERRSSPLVKETRTQNRKENKTKRESKEAKEGRGKIPYRQEHLMNEKSKKKVKV